MCRDFNGYHSGGSSFVYVNDFWLLQNFLYTHRYKLSSKKKKKGKESPYMVSHPEIGSDSPIRSDLESGRDRNYYFAIFQKIGIFSGLTLIVKSPMILTLSCRRA